MRNNKQNFIQLEKHDSDVLIESSWNLLEKLNHARNQFHSDYLDIMRKFARLYQPFCLKDFFFYSNDKKMFDHVSRLDQHLDEMEAVLRQPELTSAQPFKLKKKLFDAAMNDAADFLKTVRNTHIEHFGVYYHKKIDSLANAIKSKRNFYGFEQADHQLRVFIEKVDALRLFFNALQPVPEVQAIRSLINEIKLADGANKSRLYSMQNELEAMAASLEKSIASIKAECEVEYAALQAAVNNMRPIQYMSGFPIFFANSNIDTNTDADADMDSSWQGFGSLEQSKHD